MTELKEGNPVKVAVNEDYKFSGTISISVLKLTISYDFNDLVNYLSE